MSRPVTVVVPALDDRELLARSLPPVLAELEARALGDELLVVDDGGEGELAEHLAGRFPTARVVVREENGGFAAALRTGVEAARHTFVFCMNPDVIPRAGFLGPLTERLADERVFAAAPVVLHPGDTRSEETLPRLVLQDGLPVLRRAERALEPDRAAAGAPEGLPAAFALGGACLVRRHELLEAGFDPLFAPFYWEDVDLCWRAWRSGRRVVVDPRAVVVHESRGTIGPRVPERVVRAAIEKNRLLFAWKHLDEPRLLREHLAALEERLVEALVAEDRDALLWLGLALEQLDELAPAAARGRGTPSFSGIQRASDAGRPPGGGEARADGGA